jgi:predicted amidohydrolase
MDSPSTDLTISLVQTEIVWHGASENCHQLEQRLETVGQTDLIVLPEMFNSGFTMHTDKVAEDMSGPTVAWLKHMANKHQAAITGSLVIRDGDTNYNRMIFAEPNGKVSYYDKRHLFRMADEQKRYGAGKQRVIVNWRGWRIALYVCYDLRFPVWCRNQNDTDLMLFIASWPAVRRYPWQMLLKSRAIENLCYVCGVNRIGTDGNGFEHSGDSAIIDMKGQDLVTLNSDNIISSYTISATELEQFRANFPAWMDSDCFEISAY